MNQHHCEELQAHNGGSVVRRREQEQEEQQDLLELDHFQMVLMVVAVALLAASALYWLVICYSRSRQISRALSYESAVRRWECPEEEKVLRRSSSFFNPLIFFRRSKISRESSIFYIYSTPLPVGLSEEQEEQQEQQTQERPEPFLFHVQQ